ncbi:citrate/2-methylcitrate synthase [Leifsonia poae]|uniref:citrate/2-methylcitrate synthase n=1 Tax=Leifsonia poae TaxID=110933 RepID=UPI003D6686A4
MTEELPALTAEQTAERLGIKLETLYAYVARGRLSRIRTAAGSTFDPLEVERFAANRRQRSAAAPSAARAHSDGRPLMVIETGFAHIEDGDLYYRDREAVELARNSSFETVAHWALTGVSDAEARFTVARPAVVPAGHVADAMPAAATHRDRQQVAVTALAAADPLRYSLETDVVVSAVEALVAGMVEVLPLVGGASPVGEGAVGGDDDASIAERLWTRLTDRPVTTEGVRELDAALVLLIDHDIAISTLAARAAASARANPYAVVTAGLGALDSPLHGNASRAAHRMLARVLAGEHPERVIADTMVSGRGTVPGFGQVLYRGADPRGVGLLGMLREHPEAADVVEAVERVAAIVGSRTGTHPNVDLALAAVALANGMIEDAGEVIFATARTVGWIVHALDEYSRRPLRLRPVGRYVG